MKNIKLGKKEYFVIEKEELNKVLYELEWRIAVCESNATLARYAIHNATRDNLLDHSSDMFKDINSIFDSIHKEIW